LSGLRLFGSANQAVAPFTPKIPKTWDDGAVAKLEVPLVNAAYSPVHVGSEAYYQLPVRPVYKSYAIYVPGKERDGYIAWLQQQEPEIAFDASTLKTESDWIRAGELVFDAPTQFVPSERLRDPDVYTKTQMPLTGTGVMPFRQYVIRKKGMVEAGNGSCAQCHTRVMSDGTVVKGAQGNHPGSREVCCRSLKTDQGGSLKIDQG
jgi:hypothetical protein